MKYVSEEKKQIIIKKESVIMAHLVFIYVYLVQAKMIKINFFHNLNSLEIFL